MSPTLAVVGAINVDLVARVLMLPGPGETVTGGEFARHHGGKGGNQATAAARALRGTDASVAMIGAVGGDDLGREATSALEAEGIALQVWTLDAPTGVALIVVDSSGENQIAVAPGANVAFGGQQVDGALSEHRPDVVLVSLEALPDAAMAAAGYCAAVGATLVLDPAPPSLRTRALLPMATYVTPNESERAAMGRVPDGVVVIETRGAEGAVIHRDDDPPILCRPHLHARRYHRRRRLLQRRVRRRRPGGTHRRRRRAPGGGCRGAVRHEAGCARGHADPRADRPAAVSTRQPAARESAGSRDDQPHAAVRRASTRARPPAPSGSFVGL